MSSTWVKTAFSIDPMGFPLVEFPTLGLQMHLLPITKVQFEHFLAESRKFDDNWYETVLKLNPRVSYRNFTADKRERLFLTGILIDEAQEFANWLGEEFDLPTADEWRACYKLLRELKLPTTDNLLNNLNNCSKPAQIIIRRLLSQIHPKTLLELSLMEEGVMEWVKGRDAKWKLLGKPRQSFQPALRKTLEELHPFLTSGFSSMAFDW